MSTETALPQSEQVVAEAGAEEKILPAGEQVETPPEELDADGNPKPKAAEPPPKKEKTPEEREIARLRRRVDNLTRQKYELAGRSEPVGDLHHSPKGDSRLAPDADEPVTLSRAEIAKLIAEQAKPLAQQLATQRSEIEHRAGIVEKLAKSWGEEKFDSLAADLDAAFGGLKFSNGADRPAAAQIFHADDPGAVIEYLADPDNQAEASRLSGMGEAAAIRTISRLEAKLQAEKMARAEAAKPKPSKAAAPLEGDRASGQLASAPDPANTREWIRWKNEQERRGHT